ncbi:MAG: class I SAM-dependent methyltransferase [Actinomycetota bacterium]
MTTVGRWSGYAPMARHVAPAAARLLDLVGAARGPVLDVGSGTGLALEIAREAGTDAIGIDASITQLTAAGDGLRQAAADARALPFGSASFAAAISNVALIFVPDPARAADEIARVLRPDAPFAFSAWQTGGWPDACRRILADALDRPHVAFPTDLGDADRAAALLDGAGFTGIEHHHGILRWWFDDLDDAVDTLTTAAGGLRLLRTDLEADAGWPAARAAIADELGRRTHRLGDQLILDDPYLITLGRSSAAGRSPTLPREETP